MTPATAYAALQRHQPCTIPDLYRAMVQAGEHVRIEVLRARLQALKSAGCVDNTRTRDANRNNVHIWRVTAPLPAMAIPATNKRNRPVAKVRGAYDPSDSQARPVTLPPAPWELTDTPARATMAHKEQDA